MISVICPTFRVGGLDVLFSSLRESTYQDFEVIVVDELRGYRHSLPHVGKGTWHIGPGTRQRWGNYMRSLQRGVEMSRGDVLLFWTDYTAPHPETLKTHAEFHAAHGENDVMLGGIEYTALPPLHPDFPNRYGWNAMGHDVADHKDETYAPWLDKATRHRLCSDWRQAYEADLAAGLLEPFMHSVFASPVTGWADVEKLRVFQTNDRSPPSFHMNLKNDSMRRSLLHKLGSFDMRADGTHGHQDSITERQLLKLGAKLHVVPQNPVRILDAHGVALIRRFDAGKDDEANLKLAAEAR